MIYREVCQHRTMGRRRLQHLKTQVTELLQHDGWTVTCCHCTVSELTVHHVAPSTDSHLCVVVKHLEPWPRGLKSSIHSLKLTLDLNLRLQKIYCKILYHYVKSTLMTNHTTLSLDWHFHILIEDTLKKSYPLISEWISIWFYIW